MSNKILPEAFQNTINVLISLLSYKVLTYVIICNTICYMRTIVNISLPVQLNTVVETEVKTGQYASKSEFFRSLLRSWMENRALLELEESRKELKAGRGKLLKSFKDLR